MQLYRGWFWGQKLADDKKSIINQKVIYQRENGIYLYGTARKSLVLIVYAQMPVKRLDTLTYPAAKIWSSHVSLS